MNILAIETSSGACSAAVLTQRDGADAIEQVYGEMRQGHAEALMGMIAEAMQRSGIAFTSLDRIAVGIGPGSFTGTRVGIAAGRGLALATGADIVGASSLAIIARMALERQPGRAVAVGLEAGRGEIYFQAFDTEANPLDRAAAMTLDAATARVPSDGATIAGSAGPALWQTLHDAGAEANLTDVKWPTAAMLAQMATTLQPGSEAPVPLYIRAADAKPPTAGIIGRRP